MPGIYGFYQSTSQNSPEQLLRNMLAVTDSDDRFHHELLLDNDFGLAISTIEKINPGTQLVWNGDHSVAIAFLGELFDRQALFSKYKIDSQNEQLISDSALVSLLYERNDTEFVSSLNGAFLIAIWDQAARKLILINDRMGLYPLYYGQSEHGFIFGSNIKPLLLEGSLPRRPDQTAIAEFLTFDHILGQRTLLNSVKLMPQASLMTFDANALQIKPYYQFHYRQQHEFKTDEMYMQELDFYIRQAITRQMKDDRSKGLLLSGGLDSRYILAVMTEIDPNHLHTFTWSIPRSDDARFALECARLAHSQHHFYPLEADWMLNKAEKAILLTSGNGNIINLHAFATLEEEASIVQTIYKGFLGDAMFGFGVRPRFWADYDRDTMIAEHLEAYRDYRVLTFDPKLHAEFFTDSFINATAVDWMEDFTKGMLASNCKQMTDQRSYFDLTQRVPRMTINGVDVVRDLCLVRLPFADNDLLEFSLTIPPHLRYQRTLVDRTFIQNYPQYAKIPIAQSQLPMIQCAREVWIRNKQFIQWHLRNRGFNRLAGPVSRPYKDYNTWFRTALKPMVENTLLNPVALERGYLKPEKIKQLVADHMAGENFASRIGALLTLEIAHQQLID